MKISELIPLLHKAKNEYGDVEIYIPTGKGEGRIFAPVVMMSENSYFYDVFSKPGVMYLLCQDSVDSNSSWCFKGQFTKEKKK